MVRYHWYQHCWPNRLLKESFYRYAERIFLSIRIGINAYSCSGNFTNYYNKSKATLNWTTSMVECPENPDELDEILALKLDISEK